MRDSQRPLPDTDDWQHTLPVDLMLDESGRDAVLRPLSPVQPPLREVLQGLDARELEGETVFDQLFGS